MVMIIAMAMAFIVAVVARKRQDFSFATKVTRETSYFVTVEVESLHAIEVVTINLVELIQQGQHLMDNHIMDAKGTMDTKKVEEKDT